MFNWIQIRRLRRPFQHRNLLVIKPFACCCGGVLGIIVLLKNDFAPIQAIVLQCLEEFVLEDIHIERSVHSSVDPARIANSLGCHTAPDHQRTSAKLRVPSTCWSVSALPGFFHAHLRPSDPIRLILVSSDQTTRSQSSTVQCWYRTAKSIRCRRCLGKSRGFFTLDTAFRPASFRARPTVFGLSSMSVVLRSSRVK